VVASAQKTDKSSIWYVPPHSKLSVLHWVLQRFSGVLLVVLIGIHLLVVHFIPLGIAAAEQFGVSSYQATFARVSSGLFFAIDWSMLVVAVYHGLNGVRMVFLDLSPNPKVKSVTAVGLTILGIVAIFYGTWILVVVIGAPPT